MRREGDKNIFAFHISFETINAEDVEHILQEFDQIDFSTETRYREVPINLSRTDHPTREEWNDIFNTAHTSIKDEQIEKIVLARKTNFEFDKALDPVALLKHLKDMTPNCYHFCFQTNKYEGFVGASPERLFKLDQKEIETEAIAGTATRGDNGDTDTKMGDSLSTNTKTVREHHIVVEMIQNILKDLCDKTSMDKESRILKLREAQHLLTQFKGSLKENINWWDVIQKLHPTPAVCGHPTEKARETLKHLEPFQREWYAGPIGTIGINKAEFTVGIRSAMIQKEILSLFAGAGILKGSDAAEEWNEIENKIRNFMDVFKLNEE